MNIYLTIALYIAIACSGGEGTVRKENFIPWNDARIYTEGRINTKGKRAAEIYWSGSSVTVCFEGPGIQVKLKDEKGTNYYDVIVDGGDISVLHPDTLEHFYTLAQHLSHGPHCIQVFKRTQWDKGKTWFYGLLLPPGAHLLPAPPAKKKRIVFYGDSITSGSAVEDPAGNSGEAVYENNYAGYAAITARHYNAAFQCIARSGIGLVVSWYPLIMPELYNRLNPGDTSSRWSPAQFVPQIIVVNLWQNDAWLLKQPTHPQYKARFGTRAPTPAFIERSYARFIRLLRRDYPTAAIICALGNMDAVAPGSPWPGYIRKAAEALHDPNIHTCFFTYKGTPGHPDAAAQQRMANELVQFIDAHIRW